MKLSLRELFLLVALVAMGCGWWVDRGRLSSENADLLAGLQNIIRKENALMASDDNAMQAIVRFLRSEGYTVTTSETQLAVAKNDRSIRISLTSQP